MGGEIDTPRGQTPRRRARGGEHRGRRCRPAPAPRRPPEPRPGRGGGQRQGRLPPAERDGPSGEAPARPRPADSTATGTGGDTTKAGGEIGETLEKLPVKGKAPKTCYAREKFGAAWTDDNDDQWGHNGLDSRSDVLSEQLEDVVCKTPPSKKSAPHCAVQSGVLHDPYTGKTIHYQRGPKTGSAVQVDHVVALSWAWQTGAQQLSPRERVNLANDPLELIAVDGPTNEAKGDGDAATWLPPNKAFRCEYVSRQIRVKAKYRLWVTPPEKQAMLRVLSSCAPDGAAG